MKKLILTLTLIIISVNLSHSQIKVNFFLSNFRDSAGYLMGDLMFTVLPGQVWAVGAANIRVTDSTTGTGSLLGKAENPAFNSNPNLCDSIGHSYISTTGSINCNILAFTTYGFYRFTSGTYRICTLRWTKTPPLSSITFKFRVPPSTLPTVIYDSTVLLTYGTNYTVGNPVTVSISNVNAEVPNDFKLYENYPNPFNPKTNIKFDLPKSAFVTLKIYDIEGREIETLVNQNMEAGIYEFIWDASKFASGIYFYRLFAGDFSSIKKMVLLK